MDKRHFLKSLGLLAGTAPFLSFSTPSKMSAAEVILPKAVKKGDTVGLIAPSAATADRMEFIYAKEAMEALAFNVQHGQNLQHRAGPLAGTDEERAGDLNSLF